MIYEIIPLFRYWFGEILLNLFPAIHDLVRLKIGKAADTLPGFAVPFSSDSNASVAFLILPFVFQFFLELMKVPRVESKLRVFLFKIQFNSQVCVHLEILDEVFLWSSEFSFISGLRLQEKLRHRELC